MSTNLFDKSYDDFKRVYFSDSMQSFIREAYALKKRCRRLWLICIACTLAASGAGCVAVYIFGDVFNLSLKDSWILAMGYIFLPLCCCPVGFSYGKRFDTGVELDSYHNFYKSNFEKMYGNMTMMRVKIQHNYDAIQRNCAFFSPEKSARINPLKDKGATIGSNAKFFIDVANTTKRIAVTYFKYVGYWLIVFSFLFFIMIGLNQFVYMATLRHYIDPNIIVKTFCITFIFIFGSAPFWSTIQWFFGFTNFMCLPYLSVIIKTIRLPKSKIRIKHERIVLKRYSDTTFDALHFPKNQLRFNRIDMNRYFNMIVDVDNEINLTEQKIKAKTIVTPIIEDLLSYINKKYNRYDLIISSGRVDIVFLGNFFALSKDRLAKRLMNPALFFNTDLYISNLYKFYEIIELVKLIEKYFYGEGYSKVTETDRQMLKRSADMEKIPYSNFARDSRNFFKQIINSK